jgi:uncharacterized protein
VTDSGASADERRVPPLTCDRHRRLWREVAPWLPRADLAHDELHLRRVYGWAVRLAPEAGADPDLAGAAALVHDLVDVPKEDPGRPLAAERSADAARDLLARAGYASREIEEIAEAVRTSSWSRGLAATRPLGEVLQDADRLDAIGAVGIARTFACAQGMAGRGRALRLYDAEDPLGRARAVDEARNAIDHFATKLLRLAATMHLPTARAEATRRHAVMQAFLDELARELSPTVAPRGC